jgi:hypothetical protein
MPRKLRVPVSQQQILINNLLLLQDSAMDTGGKETSRSTQHLFSIYGTDLGVL